MPKHYTAAQLALALIHCQSQSWAGSRDETGLLQSSHLRVVIIDGGPEMVEALELACHALNRPLLDVQRGTRRVMVHTVDAFGERHMENPRRAHIEVRSIDGYSPPSVGNRRGGHDAIDLLIVGPNRRKGWASELVRALPAKRVLLIDWGLDHIEAPVSQWDEPSLDYRHYLDARARVEPRAFAGRLPSDEDLALLVLCSLDREKRRRAKSITYDGLPSCTIVQGTIYYGGQPFGDNLESVLADTLYYGLRDGIYEGKLSTHGKRWLRWLTRPTLETARLLAVTVLTECELAVSAADIECVGQALFTYADKLTAKQRRDLVAIAKQGRPKQDEAA